MIRLAVLGDVMLDATLVEPEVLRSHEASAGFVVRGGEWRYNLGGAGNVAEVLGTSDWEEALAPILVGAIGNDEAGSIVQQLAESVCKPTHPGLMVFSGRPTTVKYRFALSALPPTTPRLDFETTQPVSMDWSWVKKQVARADAVVLSDYQKGSFAEWPENWLDLFPDGVPVVADVKPAAVPRFSGATAWCPNGRELLALADDFSLDWTALAEAVCEEHGFRFVCVTLGWCGCYVVEEKRKTFLPSLARNHETPAIGAGDAFAAGLAVSLARDPDGLGESHATFAQTVAQAYVERGRHRHCTEIRFAG